VSRAPRPQTGKRAALPPRDPDGVILFHGVPIAAYWAGELPK